jgi:hypothetical protein
LVAILLAIVSRSNACRVRIDECCSEEGEREVNVTSHASWQIGLGISLPNA